jgi:hypothetical protein
MTVWPWWNCAVFKACRFSSRFSRYPLTNSSDRCLARAQRRGRPTAADASERPWIRAGWHPPKSSRSGALHALHERDARADVSGALQKRRRLRGARWRVRLWYSAATFPVILDASGTHICTARRAVSWRTPLTLIFFGTKSDTSVQSWAGEHRGENSSVGG